MVLPYLLTGNVRSANKALLLFTSKLGMAGGITGGGAPAVQEVSTASADTRIYPTLPLLNFLGLLLLAVQRGAPDLFRQLKSHYASNLKEVQGTWGEALDQIGETYFAIKIPSKTNPLFDMMGSLLMGGGGGSKGGSKSKAKPKVEAPPNPGLD